MVAQQQQQRQLSAAELDAQQRHYMQVLLNPFAPMLPLPYTTAGAAGQSLNIDGRKRAALPSDCDSDSDAGAAVCDSDSDDIDIEQMSDSGQALPSEVAAGDQLADAAIVIDADTDDTSSDGGRISADDVRDDDAPDTSDEESLHPTGPARWQERQLLREGAAAWQRRHRGGWCTSMRPR